jgi:hypothetical protein
LSEGHEELLVATMRGLAKTLAFQQWQPESVGKVPEGQNRSRFSEDDGSFVDDLFSNGETVRIGD